MSEHHYTVRTARPDEIAVAVEWAAGEGWNPGLNDAACYGAIDEGGFLVGVLDGEPIATISAVRYGSGFGFIGFYIVRADKRGQGWGLKIWNAAMVRLRGRVIGLDGVVAQQDNYKKSGFALAYRNVRYEGRGGGGASFVGATVPLDQVAPELLFVYERPFFPENRSAFVQGWVRQPGATALGVVRDGRLCGYGVRRPCRQGHKIAPLFAEDTDVAELLFSALTEDVPANEPVFLDVPERNAEAVALAERHGMSVCFETARMYAGVAPELPLARVFGVTSFEVG